MSNSEKLIRALQEGEHDEILRQLYALDGKDASLEKARKRAIRAVEEFVKQFTPSANADIALFSGPGRTEIGGNHTDHQHG